MSTTDAARADLRETIGRYNDAWNAHDLDAIIALHAPDMVFENHTAGERAEGPGSFPAARRWSALCRRGGT